MWILPVVVLALASAGASDDRPSSPLLAPGSSWQKVVGGLGFGEGPAWHPDGYLLFEDVANNRTLKLDRADQVSVFRETTDGANGLAFDAARRLVACEGHAAGRGRRLVRIEKDGTLTVLAERYGGKRLNSPNDLAIDRRGRIYFTDPRYSKREDLELDREAVYRVDPDRTVARVIDSLTRMTLDADGRIWATAGTKERAGIYVFTPDAKRSTARLVSFVAIDEDPTNCTFGGAGRDVLYVTTTSSLYRMRTSVRGQKSPPGK